MLTFLNSVFSRGRNVAATRKNLNHTSTVESIQACNNVAQWVYDNYRSNSGTTLPALLHRQFDFRMCSLTCYYISVDLFSSIGASFVVPFANVLESLNLKLNVFPSGRVADVGSNSKLCMPAGYRGYGEPIYSPDTAGHLFRINLTAFTSLKPVVGIQDWQGHDEFLIVKGMRPKGKSGTWKLYELDPELTDDLTALFIVPTHYDIQVELANFSDDMERPQIFYRFSTIKGVIPNGSNR